MIKNIILDIGGVLFDDSDKNLTKVLNKPEDEIKEISKIAFGKEFKKCLIGEKKVEEYIEELKKLNLDNISDIIYVIEPQKYNITFPKIQDMLDIIPALRKNKYKVFLLSNITEAAFGYINSVIDLESFVDGGVYSFKEGNRKPNEDFYEILINRYNLNKDECIFFDDKKQNVDIANKIGIKSYVFESKEKVLEYINFNENI